MRAYLLVAVLVAVSTFLAGCDGLYSATASGDGNVIVVNRITGEARSIRGDTIVDVKPPPTAPMQIRDYRPTLVALSINDQPFTVGGFAKFRDGNLLVRVMITPSNESMSEAEWTEWRTHVALTRGTASLNLQFLDDDGFEVASKTLPLSTMTQELGMTGKMASLDEQVAVPMTEAAYKVVKGWNITWGGYWPPYSSRSNGPKPAK